MRSYKQAVHDLQPIIDPLFKAIQDGLVAAQEDHLLRSFVRSDDPWFYLHATRRFACQQLREQGLQATVDGSRFLLAMSGLSLTYQDYAVRVLHSAADPATTPEVPVPGRSRTRQRFWRQEPTLDLRTENLLLLWRDDQGELIDPMHLVRPVGGDHRRDSLRVTWHGKLYRSMAGMRAADLDELEPDWEYKTLEDEGA